MLVRIALWDLTGSKTSVEELRDYLRDESVEAFSKVPGLRYKAWISDPATNRWGAVYLWESREASRRQLPGKARAMIGSEPVIQEFEVEATIQGVFEVVELSRRGLAFESDEEGSGG
ncbi:MAG: YdhR family protein [Actinomycetota bacterium]